MFRQLVRTGQRLAKLNLYNNNNSYTTIEPIQLLFRSFHLQPQSSILTNHYRPIQSTHHAATNHQYQQQQQLLSSFTTYLPQRQFHAAGSKVRYLDFRHRFKTSHLRLHLLIIRRQKMKKHKRRKWRRKFKCLLAKQRLKREIAKEKAFRVELLSMIRLAENFDPKEYALRKIAEINNKPKTLTKEEKLEELKELIRKNRYQVDYIKPKHRRAELV